MYVAMSHRSVQEAYELRLVASQTLAVLRQTLACAVDRDGGDDYGVDLADAATFADMTSALKQFLERDAERT